MKIKEIFSESSWFFYGVVAAFAFVLFIDIIVRDRASSKKPITPTIQIKIENGKSDTTYTYYEID